MGSSNPESFGSGKSSAVDSIFTETLPFELLTGVLPRCFSSVKVMNENKLGEIVLKALTAACDRGQELSKTQ